MAPPRARASEGCHGKPSSGDASPALESQIPLPLSSSSSSSSSSLSDLEDDPWNTLTAALKELTLPKTGLPDTSQKGASSHDEHSLGTTDDGPSSEDYVPSSLGTPVSIQNMLLNEQSLEDPKGAEHNKNDWCLLWHVLQVFYLTDPRVWDPICSELETLEPGLWLSISCIDYYLLLSWFQNKVSSVMRYMTPGAVNLCSKLAETRWRWDRWNPSHASMGGGTITTT